MATIIKIQDGDSGYYMEWSTALGAPLSDGMSFKDLIRYLKYKYGSKIFEDISEGLPRLETMGTSHLNETLSSLIFDYRGKMLGASSEQIKEQLLNKYCRK